MFLKARFEVGDAPVLEAHVRPCGLEPLVEGSVVGGELADALFEGGVLGGDALDGLLGPLGFEVADAAEDFADAGALGEDLGVGRLEPLLDPAGLFCVTALLRLDRPDAPVI
jgi:hypothetical protein